MMESDFNATTSEVQFEERFNVWSISDVKKVCIHSMSAWKDAPSIGSDSSATLFNQSFIELYIRIKAKIHPTYLMLSKDDAWVKLGGGEPHQSRGKREGNLHC